MHLYRKKQAFYQGDSEDKVEEQEKPHLPDKSGRRRPNRRPKWRPSRPPTGKFRSQPRFDSGPGKDRRLPTLDRRRPPTVAACGTRGRNQPPIGQTRRQAARQDGRRPPAGPPAAAGVRRDPSGSDLPTKRWQAAIFDRRRPPSVAAYG
ncbi:unnamed protein product [Cuscuta epithymum]|uniref:Uncharacterized protein n=1 Tax=Cuscuta epithymum TaxID=186058 RepID=A0AAV0GH41_9ASTE|nr:unnamed protein product [Cuscuta epithymum]